MTTRRKPVAVAERGLGRVVAVAALGILAAFALAWALDRSDSASAATASAAAKGGVYRTSISSMGLTDNLDPTGENAVSVGFALLAALQKPLIGFNGAAGAAGEVPRPVLAKSVPKPTDHGLTYTFHLRHVKFGPPVNRAITSKDVAYAFQRINDKSLVPSYAYYYIGLIKGLTGKAKTREHEDLWDQDSEQDDHRLPPHPSTRRLSVARGRARNGSDSTRSRKMLHEAGNLRAGLHLIRAVHDPRFIGRERLEL